MPLRSFTYIIVTALVSVEEQVIVEDAPFHTALLRSREWSFFFVLGWCSPVVLEFGIYKPKFCPDE